MRRMIMNFIRNNKVFAGVLAFIRIYIGYAWITAGIGKLGSGFDASGFIQGAIASAEGADPAVQGWWATFLEAVALPKDRKSTRLNSSHVAISYAVFCLKKKKNARE